MNKYGYVNSKRILVGVGVAKCLTDEYNSTDILNIEITDEVFDNWQMYIYQDGEIILDPDYEAKAQAKEAERIAKLTMTSLDFITFLETLGLTLEAITAWLELPENLRIKTQLTYCQNVYCGVVTQLLPITLGDITITEDMVVNAFKAKYGEV